MSKLDELDFENSHTEYKRCLNDRFESAVIAFLNSSGGKIYIGIDNDSSVYGVENPDEIQRQIADRIKNNIRGECLGLYDIVPEKRDGKTVIKLIISSGTEKPYYLKEKGMTSEGCFIRNGSRIENMTSAMIEKAFARRTRTSLSVIKSPRQDLRFEQLQIYYQTHGKKLNDQFASSLNFLTEEGKYNLNAFLFADNNDITIKVAKFAGTDKTQLIENEEFGFCSIIKACKDVLDKLNVENRTLARVTYPFRQEKRLVEADSLREAVINAFVHNDYSDLMSPTFYIFSDRLEIVSYGGLIDGMSKAELVSGLSRPRNREVMRVFKDVDLVEQLGTGMNKMMEAYSPNIFTIYPNFLKVVFYFRTLDSDTKMENPSQRITSDPINDPINLIDLIKENPYANYDEYARMLEVSPATVKRQLGALKKSGKIRREGAKKNGHWEILK